jgi:hypothetical protein
VEGSDDVATVVVVEIVEPALLLDDDVATLRCGSFEQLVTTTSATNDHTRTLGVTTAAVAKVTSAYCRMCSTGIGTFRIVAKKLIATPRLRSSAP